MNEADVLFVIRQGIWTGIQVVGPALIVALGVGLAIAFVQALTQIQEMTLTFVPKMAAVFVILMISMPFMMRVLHSYTDFLKSQIVSG